MGVYTKEYFLLGVEIDFHKHPISTKLTDEEEFSFLYEGFSNPRKHEAGQMIQVFDEQTGIITVGYALAVKGEFDDTIGSFALTEANLTRWREEFEPLVNEHVFSTFGLTQRAEFKLFTHFW